MTRSSPRGGLAPCERIDPAGCGIARPERRLAKRPAVLERIGVGEVVIEKDTGV